VVRKKVLVTTEEKESRSRTHQKEGDFMSGFDNASEESPVLEFKGIKGFKSVPRAEEKKKRVKKSDSCAARGF